MSFFEWFNYVWQYQIEEQEFVIGAMKILKFVNGNDDGGIFTSECNYIQSFKNKGIIVDVVIIGNGDRVKAYQKMAYKSILLAPLHSNLGGSFFSKIREIFKIWSYGNRYTREVTSLNAQYSAIVYRRPIFIFLAGMVGGVSRTKVFWHMPNIVSNGFSKIFYTFFLKRYRIVPLANSEYTRATLSNICKHVIYPGFSTDRIRVVTESFRQELHISEGAPVFGMAGRICLNKAQDILIQAFLKSSAFKCGGHLVLAGSFESKAVRDNLVSLAGEQLDKKIHFIGRIDDLPKFYSTIDVALNARRNAEPFGISIAEGLAAGKPVIAYYLGGPSEMIVDNVSGWLVKKPDIQSWVSAFDVAMTVKNKWSEIGRAAALSVGKFNVENNTAKFLELIEE
ncbi:hypothetical protein GCM10007415_10640 [Parapedobacter pyrenivorans]|uniref:Glycosyl transferase family 1 domain-containing protein n=1 Tax=Parapedobacter pyrenivorans TaxID=1305674 RepID=A0A917M5F3_9SPHI|nr:glycosyltransferase family 4 protein [Parapedobacter pyrenivorans]GGG80129.1 hypothetical protein GCM10007415_10640 [Parapedobacter pyrenivorans]